MACNEFIYQGVKYSEEGMLAYIAANPEEFEEEYLQKEDKNTIPSKAGATTLAQVEEFLKRKNIEIKELQKSTGVNGRAIISPLGSFVEYISGNKDTVLPEETMHIATAMLKQSNPKLWNDMLKDISSYNIYGQVYEAYTKDKATGYFTPEGKPDVGKIRKEAIDKLLVEMVINKNGEINEDPAKLLKTQNWWDKVVDWFKNLFGSGYNPFKEAADKVLSQDTNLREDTKEEYHQLSDGSSPEEQKAYQQDLSRRLDEQLQAHGVQKIEQPATTDEEEDINKYVRTVEGKQTEVARVTDIVKSKKSKEFLAKMANASKEDKSIRKQKADWGTKFHKDAENIVKAATDSEGYLKNVEDIDISGLAENVPGQLGEIYNYLVGSKNLPGILYTQFPTGTLFKTEQQVFDPERKWDGKKGLAGTIDLMGITPDGRVIIKDWKTKFLNLTKYDDIPIGSKKDYNIQLLQYKKILEKAYGVDYNKISAQAQPIIYEGAYNRNTGILTPKTLTLPGDIKTEDRKYLLPVATRDEKTGNPALDEHIKKLYVLYDHLYKRRDDNKDLKIEQLNAIASSIRELQIRQNFTPALAEAQIFMKGADRVITDINSGVKGKDSVDPKLFEDLRERAKTILDNIDKYATFYGIFNDIYGKEPLSEGEEKVRQSLKDLAAETTEKRMQVTQGYKDLLEYLGKEQGVDKILDIEKSVQGFLNRSIQSTPKLQTYAIRLFYKLESTAKTKRDVAIQEMDIRFKPILKAYEEYARNGGVAAKDFLSLIQQKDKEGKPTNQLVKKLKTEVYTLLEKATTPGQLDINFIKDNVDVEAFKKDLEGELDLRMKGVEETHNPALTDEENNDWMTGRKKALLEEYDTTKDNSLGWYKTRQLNKHILENKWYTDEYRALRQTPALLAMYSFIEDLNSLAARTGYHRTNFHYSRRFLPWVHKDLNPVEFLGDLFTVHDEEKEYYGKIDPATGRLEKHVPKPFLSPLEKDFSTDIGKNISLYLQAVLNHQYLSEIEGKADLIQTIEKVKKHYVVGRNGELMKDINNHDEFSTEEGNDQNERLLQQQVDALLHGQHYSAESGLGSAEANKIIEGLNKWTQLKVFALNFISPFVNGIGGTIQATTNSGRFWKKRQWAQELTRVSINAFRGKEGNLEKGLLDFFIPLTENPNRHHIKQMTSSKLHKHTFQEVMMKPMRASDILIQQATALSMIKNSALVEGKIINVRDYIRKADQVKYATPSLIKEKEKTYEQRVSDFINNDPRMLSKLATFNKEGLLEVAGIDRNSEEFAQFRRRVQNEIKNIVGAATEDETKEMERNVLLRSMMMFKGWIEPLVQVRFGGLKVNARTDEMELGRTRIWWQLVTNGFSEGKKNSIFNGLTRSMTDLRDIWACNTHGLQLLQEYYKRTTEQYKKQTGKDLEMTPEDFYDMTRRALRQQAKDVLALISLLVIYLGAASIEPPDDPEGRNEHYTLVRFLNKLHDEVSFYYNPLSFQQIANGSLLPSVGVLTDGAKIINASGKELFGNSDKSHPAKAFLKSVPILNQATSTILPLLSPETAKDFGFKVSSTNGITR